MRVSTTGQVLACSFLAWFRGCNSEYRTALWTNAGTTGSLYNDNVMTCASNYLGLEYGAVKMEAIVGGVCESLPFDWLTNQTFDTGYLYMIKERNKITMNPPLTIYEVSVSDNVHYITCLPLVFDEGSSIIVKFSDPTDRFVINLLNKPETTKVYHVHMRGNSGYTQFDYYTNGAYRGPETELSLPNCYSSTCEVTLLAGSDYIDMNVNNALFHRYDVTGKHPTTAVRKIDLVAPVGSQAYLHSIEFKAN